MKEKIKEIFLFLLLSLKNLIKDIFAFINFSIRDIFAIFNSNFVIFFLIYFFLLLFFPIFNFFVIILLLSFSIYLFRFILPKINDILEYFINPSFTESDEIIYENFLEQLKNLKDFNKLNSLDFSKSNKIQNLLNDFFKSFDFKDFFYYILLSINILIVSNIFLVLIFILNLVFTKFYSLKILNLITFKTFKFTFLDYLFIFIFSLLFMIQIIWYFLFPLIILKAIESLKIKDFYYNVLYIFDDLNDNNTLMFFKNLFIDIFWDSLVLAFFYLPFIIINLLFIKLIIANFIFFLLINWLILSIFLATFLTLFFIRFVKNYYLYFYYL
jgi:hypothetical protein